MKERPILFSAPMVRAILAGTKTVTRRMIKPSWSRCLDLDFDDDRERARIGCPYGAPGDRLWVREAWRFALGLDKYKPAEVGERAVDAGYSRPWAPTQYEADCATRDHGLLRDFGGAYGKLRNARFMPRWASRITLDVVSVRVERLHDITEEDARAEGVTPYVIGHGAATASELAAESGLREPNMYRHGFEQVWCDINGSESWHANPWVWRVEFKRAEATC